MGLGNKLRWVGLGTLRWTVVLWGGHVFLGGAGACETYDSLGWALRAYSRVVTMAGRVFYIGSTLK